MSKMMESTMDYMSKKVAPKMNKLTTNPYISGLQAAILKTVPMVLASSVVTIYNVLRNFITALPSLGDITNYTFGLLGIYMAFLVPYFIMEKMGNEKKFVGGMTGVSLYMMSLCPAVTEEGLYAYNFTAFGAGGMFLAIIVGIVIAVIFKLFRKIQLFSEDSAMPDFCREWFDVLLPVFVSVFLGWAVIIKAGINLYDVIQMCFTPVINIGNTFIGALLILLVPTMFYSMGISGWVFTSIYNPIQTAALAANMAAFEAGQAMIYFNTSVVNAAYLCLGGRGNTLPLNLFYLRSKSKRLRNLGKTFLVPSILNINEPIMYASVVWNPILMIPTWITAIVNLALMWICMSIGLVTPIHETMGMWYLPCPIPALLVCGIPGGILCLVNLAVDAVIWYPFFKVYEKQCMEEDGELATVKE